jgi:thiol-disulfide isomerase/thioredoxin
MFSLSLLKPSNWMFLASFIVIVVIVILFGIGVIPNPLKRKNVDNFSNSKVKVFNFNTSWCGWSKRFQPEWDKFSKAVKDTNITAIDVKCDDDKNEELCLKYKVDGFPTVLIEVDGKVIPYKKERKSDTLIEFIKTL